MDVQKLLDQLCAEYGVRPIRYRLARRNAGYAHYGRRTITVPDWASLQGERYYLAYVLHEFAHFACGELRGHPPAFYEWEMKLLRRYNMVPIYEGTYAKVLCDLSGNIIWKYSDLKANVKAAGQKANDDLGDL